MAMAMASSQDSLWSASPVPFSIAARSAVKIPGLLHLQQKRSVDSIARKHIQGLASRNNMSAYAEVDLLSIDIVADTLPIVENERNPALEKMYVLLKVVSDRYEMHRNVREQRDNWNSLLLNSVNMMTLTAMAMAALAGAVSPEGAGVLAAKVSSGVLFSAAMGIMIIVNKIQPSQLAEEQRNASRLFKQLECEIMTLITTKSLITENDVSEFMRRVLALDRTYPLPLLGAMIEKFPSKFSPAAWCPNDNHDEILDVYYKSSKSPGEYNRNGWSAELEAEMRAVLRVLKGKDKKDFLRLGNIALKLNKAMALSGPLLMAVAAAALALEVPTTAAAAGALVVAINTMEHGGQVGMVVEMYRNCSGFFETLEKMIEGALEEEDPRKRENGEVFEIKVAMSLGRSLSEMRELATTKVHEFASKLI